MGKPIFGDESVTPAQIYGQSIDARHIDEAAEILLQFPSYEAMVEKYHRLLASAQDSKNPGWANAVSIRAAQKLRSLGQRGLDIHAWTKCYDHVDKMVENNSQFAAVHSILSGSPIGHLANDVDTWSQVTGVLFSFPSCGPLVELYLRLRNGAPGSGVIGIPTPRGMLLHGTPNVPQFAAYNGIAPTALMIFKEADGKGILQHGNIRTSFNIAIVLVYLAAIIKESAVTNQVWDIDAHLVLGDWSRRIINSILPAEGDADMIRDALNSANNWWTNFTQLFSRLLGNQKDLSDMTDVIKNQRTISYVLEGYAPFSNHLDVIQYIAPGNDDILAQDNKAQNQFRNWVSDKFLGANGGTYGDVMGPGSKELVADRSCVINPNDSKLIQPLSSDGLRLIQTYIGSVDGIRGVNDSPTDVTIQAESRYSEAIGQYAASNDVETNAIMWGFFANSCALLNNCRYSIQI